MHNEPTIVCAPVYHVTKCDWLSRSCRTIYAQIELRKIVVFFLLKHWNDTSQSFKLNPTFTRNHYPLLQFVPKQLIFLITYPLSITSSLTVINNNRYRLGYISRIWRQAGCSWLHSYTGWFPWPIVVSLCPFLWMPLTEKPEKNLISHNWYQNQQWLFWVQEI